MIEENTVNAYGGAIFHVTNDFTGNIVFEQRVIRDNPGGSWYPVCPGISMHNETQIDITGSEVTK